VETEAGRDVLETRKIKPRTVQLTAWSLHRLHYPGYSITRRFYLNTWVILVILAKWVHGVEPRT
jgi:hypothetical protein